jgi:hypothetical protein
MVAIMTPDERAGFIRLVRGSRDDHSAGLVLDAYVAACAGPNALDQIEQLDDWTYGGLLGHVLERAPVPLLDAGGLMRLRSYQLLGLLADACELAMVEGDLKTAMAMSRLAHTAILKIKGEETLAAAFGLNEADAAEVEA